jgi:glycosyltransferase involved in cell wall biosynthesis
MPEAKKLLSGSDIFLLPSRTEAFPYVILEAGMAGLPIIATNVGGIPEVIHDMQNGILVHPRNSKEIAEAILYLLDHPKKQKEFGAEIHKTISNFFSLEKMLKETITLYQ